MFKSKTSATPLPQPQDWQHRPGAPGYFVTKDGQFQMLMTDHGQFIICRTEKTRKGFAIVRGPSPNPEDLGIPPLLLEEAEALTVQHITEKLLSKPALMDVALCIPSTERKKTRPIRFATSRPES